MLSQTRASLRQAVEMINGLILDSEATVNEIIKRVTVAGGVVPALSSHTDDASHPRHSGTNIASVSKSSRKSSCGVISSSHSISEVSCCLKT